MVKLLTLITLLFSSLLYAEGNTWTQVGQASWYGSQFQGHKTANGEKFDMNSLTCAHLKLPLGSWVKVTNLANNKTVIVKVNDRGPWTGNRIIDLSAAAAKAVGIKGLGKVKLERVYPTHPNRKIIKFMSPGTNEWFVWLVKPYNLHK